MISVKKISLYELPSLIRTSYEGDRDLLDTQHVEKMPDIETAVDVTFRMIKSMAEEKKLTNYKVVHQKKSIGYFTSFDNFLYSFGINKKFRNKEVLVGWWQAVTKSLDEGFLCILYPHQIRALEFLQKNGMRIVEIDRENKAVILKHQS